MLNIWNLFAKSPFAPLLSHMEKVSDCVTLLNKLFEALEKEDYATVQKISEKISEEEHQADLIKNDIRNHLPKRIFLPIDRGQLLDILTLQDSIADRAEDIGILVTLKPISFDAKFLPDFKAFLEKNIETFHHANQIVKEINDLLESSFGGTEAEKVRAMVHEVSLKEHEADLIQRKLLKVLFQQDEKMSYSTFSLWQRILETLGSIANLSENLAHRVRTMLELK